MPLRLAAPSPAEIFGGWSRVVRGNAQADRRVPGGDLPLRIYPGNAKPSHCGRAWPAIVRQLRVRAPPVLLGDRALELFKLYAIARRAARGITFPARNRDRGTVSRVVEHARHAKEKAREGMFPEPLVGCCFSFS